MRSGGSAEPRRVRDPPVRSGSNAACKWTPIRVRFTGPFRKPQYLRGGSGAEYFCCVGRDFAQVSPLLLSLGPNQLDNRISDLHFCAIQVNVNSSAILSECFPHTNSCSRIQDKQNHIASATN
ncbi:unnamed protein product [Arctogadus glacialis]